MLWLDNPLLTEMVEFKSEMIFLFLLNQDFRPGVEKAWKLLECQLKNLLRASQEKIENDALASVHNR